MNRFNGGEDPQKREEAEEGEAEGEEPDGRADATAKPDRSSTDS